jgi:hypothetical protein
MAYSHTAVERLQVGIFPALVKKIIVNLKTVPVYLHATV